MKFISIDVETANADLASICQIGIVTFQDEKIVEIWETYINPEDEFDFMNISIHGIDEHTVMKAPTFPNIFQDVRLRLEGQVVVSHMPFDRIAIGQVIEKYKLSTFTCDWLDSAKVARRTWTEFAYSGYGLKNLSEMLGIEFKHHNAAEDARAAGEILLKATQETSININDWFDRVKRPIFIQPYREKIKREGSPDGHLYGEVVVFTGALTIPRQHAADLAANSGCQVNPSVTEITTILVVGNQDVRRLAGHEKSSKHRKAEMLIEKGNNIRILTESDFMKLAGE